MCLQNEIRFFKKIVTGCKNCPSLILDSENLLCEKTLETYDSSSLFMPNCPLEDASFHQINKAVTNEEKRMLSAAYTANIEMGGHN